MNKGFFVTIEGGEGAGKSSLIERLTNNMQQEGISVLVTREPGGISIAEKIRTIVLDTENTMMDARTEALLYAASRRQHLVEKVLPALQEGRLVICDRFVDSSLAYQGYARGLGMEQVWSINRFAIGDLMPDLTLYMDVSPEIGLARIDQAKQREVNRLDLEKLSFHEKVREGYLKLLDMYPDRMVKVDAEQRPDQVLEDVFSILKERFKGM
ncbi:dTMP kinase [Paenibacillus sp. GCM10027627]|uniref:dTMP kinase n=1 Tax=unclassified Paenibacillus TaxID=185978 RepID=UPI00363F660A